MSSFFTLPTSQKKRKRFEKSTADNTRRNQKSFETSRKVAEKKLRRNDSISGSDTDEGGKEGLDAESPSNVGSGESSSGDDEEQTGAARRLRLAQRYIKNIEGEVREDVGFDAADIDKELITRRLKEDVAEAKGKFFRPIALNYDYHTVTKTTFRHKAHQSITGIALCAPYAYTVSRDMNLVKWQLPAPPRPSKSDALLKKNTKPIRKRPIRLLSVRGQSEKISDPSYRGHVGQILCIAASSDGKYVATGGTDRRVIIWDATDLKVLRVFKYHRDAVTTLAFQRGSNTLYSGSADRQIKIFQELEYISTLFGHQDTVASIATLNQEKCVSVGSRDRTLRLWKVVEETQLVFRGGGRDNKKQKNNTDEYEYAAENSIDRVACIDEETWVTGSDNGSLCLWSIHKKKPVFTLHLAHGRDPPLQPEDAYADLDVTGKNVPSPPEARWITALKTLPFTDIFISGSSNGEIRVWRITENKKTIEAVSVLGSHGQCESSLKIPGAISSEIRNTPSESLCKGVINDLDIFERGDKGKDGLCIAAALGTSHRLGRWKKIEGRNGAVVFEVTPKW